MGKDAETYPWKPTCILTPSYDFTSPPYAKNCNSTISVDPTTSTFLSAPQDTWFACNIGLTPCIKLNYWEENAGFCFLVHVIPQVYFYSGKGGREHFQYLGTRENRAPILVPLLVGVGIAGSAAVGTAALVTGDSSYT